MPGCHGEVLGFSRPQHVLWWVPSPRAGQRRVPLSFRSPAGAIDPGPSIPVMYMAGRGQSPALMSPRGRGRDAGAGGSGQGLAGAPRAACRQLPACCQRVGSFLKDTGVSYSCQVGRCSGQARSLCSSHRAAVPLPQPLAACEATTCHDGGTLGSLMSLLAHQDSTLPRTGSSCCGSQHRPSPVPR